MTLASLLAVIDGDSGSEAVVKAAIDLGRRFDALVELLHVQVPPQDALPMLGEGASGAMVEQVMKSIEAEAERRAAEARRLFDTHCASAKLPIFSEETRSSPASFAIGLNEVVGRESDEVARRGRVVDMTLVQRPMPDEDAGYSPALEAAMFESGRPVLLVPPGDFAGFGRKVAIAWDGGRESARAVAMAMPILTESEKVMVLTAQDGTPKSKPSALGDYLAHHGIAAETWAFTPEEGPVGEALLDEAAKAGADLLVMGAYGHSRLRELVLGGVTRSVVSETTMPVLMTH